MKNLQLEKFMKNQIMFNKGIVENTTLLSKSNDGISEMIISIEKEIDELKENIQTYKLRVDDLEEENEKIKEKLEYTKEKQEKLKEDLIKVKEETNGITKTFMTNGEEKRVCEKYMHSLIWKEFEKDSLRDQLLHGYLTGKCKRHLVKTFPNVSSFNWLRIEDMKGIMGVVKSYLSAKNIHKLSQNRVEELYNEKNNKKQLKHITFQKAKQYELLELLLEEVDEEIELI